MFDQITNQKGKLNCDTTLRAVRSSLGASPNCFLAEHTLEVVLGNGATVSPGDALEMILADLRSADGLSRASTSQVEILKKPPIAEVPQITVMGPAAIGGCDTATIEVSVVSPRPATIQYSCKQDATLDEWLRSEVRRETLVIPGSLLTAENLYEITVFATSFLGEKSFPVVHKLFCAGKPPLLLSIELPQPPYLTTRPPQLDAKVAFSRCENSTQPVSHSWEVAIDKGQGFDVRQVVQTGNRPVLELQAGLLVPLWSYLIRLTSTPLGRDPTVTSRSITMGQSSLMPIILGANKQVYKYSLQTLDASASYDPDAQALKVSPNPALDFSWSCKLRDLSCRDLATSEVYSLQAASKIIVDLSKIDIPSDVDQIVFTVSVGQGSTRPRQEASVIYTLSDNPNLLDVKVSLLRFSQSGLVSFAGDVIDSDDVSWSWSISGDNLKGVSTALLSDAALCATGSSGQQLVLFIRSPLGITALLPGRYMVEVAAKTPTGFGGASLNLIIPAPPSGGNCTVDPPQQRSLTDVSLKCEQWFSDSLPLEYSFAFAEREQGGSTLLDEIAASWSPRTFARQAAFKFPEGEYLLAARIYNSVGSVTLSDTRVALIKDPVPPADSGVSPEAAFEENLGGLLESMEQLAQPSALMQISDGVARTLQAGEGGTGGSRRLLGSSAAYRMRVRRRLLRSMSATVGGAVTPRNAAASIGSTLNLVNQPDEIRVEDVRASVGLFRVSLSATSNDALRTGGIEEGLRLADKLVSATDFSNNNDAFNILSSLVDQLLLTGQTYGSAMSFSERPFEMHLSRVSLSVVLTPSGAVRRRGVVSIGTRGPFGQETVEVSAEGIEGLVIYGVDLPRAMYEVPFEISQTAFKEHVVVIKTTGIDRIDGSRTLDCPQATSNCVQTTFSLTKADARTLEAVNRIACYFDKHELRPIGEKLKPCQTGRTVTAEHVIFQCSCPNVGVISLLGISKYPPGNPPRAPNILSANYPFMIAPGIIFASLFFVFILSLMIAVWLTVNPALQTGNSDADDLKSEISRLFIDVLYHYDVNDLRNRVDAARHIKFWFPYEFHSEVLRRTPAASAPNKSHNRNGWTSNALPGSILSSAVVWDIEPEIGWDISPAESFSSGSDGLIFWDSSVLDVRREATKILWDCNDLNLEGPAQSKNVQDVDTRKALYVSSGRSPSVFFSSTQSPSLSQLQARSSHSSHGEEALRPFKPARFREGQNGVPSPNHSASADLVFSGHGVSASGGTVISDATFTRLDAGRLMRLAPPFGEEPSTNLLGVLQESDAPPARWTSASEYAAVTVQGDVVQRSSLAGTAIRSSVVFDDHGVERIPDTRNVDVTKAIESPGRQPPGLSKPYVSVPHTTPDHPPSQLEAPTTLARNSRLLTQ